MNALDRTSSPTPHTRAPLTPSPAVPPSPPPPPPDSPDLVPSSEDAAIPDAREASADEAAAGVRSASPSASLSSSPSSFPSSFPSSSLSTAASWPWALRVGFRFAFVYLVLYNMVVLANVSSSLVPGASTLVRWYTQMWQTIVPWVGAKVLSLSTPITYFPSGSGDKTSDWVLLFCYVVLALVATIVWSVADWRRSHYRWLHEWLRVSVRYAVAFTMVSYGMAKVVKLQFAYPSLARLVEPLGEFSPMGLLWTFMGYSTSYTFFAGAAELLGGLLLFFRRTTMLGALVTGGVMVNVAMMNFSYDVPVKLLATHLCAMCALLLLPEARRLLHFFVLNRPVAAAPTVTLFSRRWMRRTALALKLVVVGYALVTATTSSLQSRYMFGALAPKPPIYGIYEVEELRRDGTVIPPLLTESRRWRKVIVSTTTSFTLRLMDETVVPYRAQYDAAKSTVTLTPTGGGPGPATPRPAGAATPPAAGAANVLTWVRNESDRDRLTLQGTIDSVAYVATLRRLDETAFRLNSRGFNWINELPFNR